MIKKFNPLIWMSLLLLTSCVAGPNNYQYARPVYIAPGIGIGTIVAIVVSWSRNKSILWAVIHGILGWLYVIYVVLFLKKK